MKEKTQKAGGCQSFTGHYVGRVSTERKLWKCIVERLRIRHFLVDGNRTDVSACARHEI